MNYQTDIDFALRVLQDAEDIDFDEEKVDEMIRQKADYSRVFLPKPHLLSRIYVIAARTSPFFEKELYIEKHLDQLKTRQKRIKNSLVQTSKVWWWQRKKKEARLALQTELEETRCQITTIMTDFQSPSGLGSQRQVSGLAEMFAQVLSPSSVPNVSDDFENILYREIYSFYEKKLRQLNHISHP